ncbi:hypothetical protein NDU88_002403 [Pleurodeles waltl]|uniref:Uncharacterized protein n=1 Tax=Pleurodeles waltl TaxID=8319 RepID=A0AAV7T3B4_PLEWA|nr:hypothetical protein NDU88_002403 [Pleurodeles waltl]
MSHTQRSFYMWHHSPHTCRPGSLTEGGVTGGQRHFLNGAACTTFERRYGIRLYCVRCSPDHVRGAVRQHPWCFYARTHEALEFSYVARTTVLPHLQKS